MVPQSGYYSPVCGRGVGECQRALHRGRLGAFAAGPQARGLRNGSSLTSSCFQSVDGAAMSAKGHEHPADLLAARMDDLLSVPSWAERLASRDVSTVPSRRVAVIVALVSSLVLFVLLTVLSPGSLQPPDPASTTSVLALLGVCLTGGLLIGCWVWLDAAICRRRGGFSRLSFVLFYATGGAFLGLLLQALIPMTGYVSTAPPIVQILSIAAVGPWAAATVAAIQDGRLRIRRAQALLIHEVANVVMSSESQADLIDDLRAGLHRDLEATLLPAFAATEQRLAFEERFTRTQINSAAAEILNDLTESSIRPISQRMGQSPARPSALRSLWAWIVGVARHQPFRPLAVSGVFMLTVVADRWTVEGLESALVSTVLGVPLILVILGAGNRMMVAFPQRHGTIFVMFFLILQAPTYLAEIIEGTAISVQYIGQVCLGVLISGLIVWLTSGVGRWRAPKAELLRLFADEVDGARLDLLAQAEILRSITRQAARVLHGAVQSKLAACALALEFAITTGDEIAYVHAIEEARRVLREPWPLDVGRGSELTLAEGVNDKVALWQGLAAIDVDIAPGLRSLTGFAAAAVAEIVEEGLCNAIRHGGAVRIGVTASPVRQADSCAVHVEVVDDGRGLAGGSPGLGTAFLDEACAGKWIRGDAQGGGCRLQAWVAVPDHECT